MMSNVCNTESLSGFMVGGRPVEEQPINIQEFLEIHNVKYYNATIDIDENGEKKLHHQDQPSGWNEWSLEQLATYRKSNQRLRHNTHACHLKSSGIGLLDIDIDPKLYPKEFEEHSSYWKEKLGKCCSKSTRGKLHIYFLVHPDDPAVNVRKFKSYPYGDIDLCYNTAWEKMTKDNTIFATTIKQFTDFKKAEPKPEKVNHTIQNSKLSYEKLDIIDLISTEYLENRDSWYRIILALYAETGDVDICDVVSQKASNYESREDVEKTLRSFKKLNCSWGTIEYYARISNPKAYADIKSGFFTLECDTITDHDIALKFIEILGDSIVMDEAENLWLYNEATHYWFRDDKLNYVMNKAMDIYIPMIDNKLKKFKGKNPKELNEDPEYKKWSAFQRKIKSNKSINTIGSQVKLMMVKHKREYQFDLMRPELFCFTNCAFDLNKRKKVEITKYDYVSRNTGYEWRDPTKEETDKIKFLIKDIQPDEEIHKCLMSIMREGLYGRLMEKFIIWAGKGRNGKGLIHELLAFALGMYFEEGKPTILTEKDKGGSNPEVANLGFKRMMITSEPSCEGTLQVDVIKRLTGNQLLNARFNHSNEVRVHNMCCYIIEENEMPEFTKGGNSNAMTERTLKITFPKQFTSDESKIKSNPKLFFKEDLKYKEAAFKMEHRYALFQHLLTFDVDGLYIPDNIREQTQILLRDNDPIYNFIMSHYTIMNEMTEETKKQYAKANEKPDPLVPTKAIPHITLQKVIRKYRETMDRKVNVATLKQQIMENKELEKLGILSNSKPHTTQNKTPCLIWIQEKSIEDDVDDFISSNS